MYENYFNHIRYATLAVIFIVTHYDIIILHYSMPRETERLIISAIPSTPTCLDLKNCFVFESHVFY